MKRPDFPPTTEEHKPPSTDREERGRPVLLAAFPMHAVVPVPPSKTPLGRAWLADAGVTDPKVSSQHLRMTHEGGCWKIEDLGSRNLTFKDGHQLEPHKKVPLSDGTILRLGGTLLVFREAYRGPDTPAEPVGKLDGPFGLYHVRNALEALAKRPVHPVLIEGATGTGKEALAYETARALGRGGKFGPINIAGIAETVFEGQLFGWVRGAFSGATEQNPGVLRTHNGGAVFFDELGELPLSFQPKLLRLLDGHGVLPVGGTKEIPVDVAIIGATNRNMAQLVEAKEFRRDLLARFTFRMQLPPLDERPEDLFAIARSLWTRRFGALDPNRARVDVEAVELMMLQEWQANVRDLDRLIATMDPASGMKLSTVEKFFGIRSPATAPPATIENIERAIAAAGGNQSEAARRLGISRGSLRRRLEERKQRG